MSLNLGAAAFDAVQNLKNGRDWQVFKSALHAQMNNSIHIALESNTDRDMAVGYARAIRDVVAQIETYEQGPQKNGRMQRPIISSGVERGVENVG